MPDDSKKTMNRAAQVRARFGLGGLLKKGLDKAVLRRASIDVVHVLVLEANAVRTCPIEPGFELRFLSSDEVDRFSADPANQIGSEFVERARGGLDLCFAALRGDELASSCWVALRSVEGEHAAGADLGLPSDTAYLYKGFTHPDFRGRDLYPACMAGALAALRARGIDRLVAFVYWSNEAALRSCEQAGYRKLGRLVVGPAGPLHVPIELRRLGVTFDEAARASIARTRADRGGRA